MDYNVDGYRLIENVDLKDIKGRGLIYEHCRTGAKVVVLDNEDTHLSFTAAFKTPPVSDNGITHILEHSVFCGSTKYPLKDPFVELMKGSMYTFLNAITYGDMTVFPVASTNARDFDNLMDVYLDAVFNPLFLTNEAIFMQEGWHYQVKSHNSHMAGGESISDTSDDNGTACDVSGVVFNEMRGMEASPDYILNNKIKAALYPDTPYKYISGGLPSEIIDLSYEELSDYYDKHYHPSNCTMILYGKLDINNKLAYIAENYLDKYEKRSMDNTMPVQKGFDIPAEEECFYPAEDGENTEKGTYYAYAAVVADSHSAELSVTLQVLNYVLCLAPGAYLREAFMEAGVGEDLDIVMDDQMRQAFYGFECSYCYAGEKEKFLNIINDTLNKVVNEGIDKEMLYAAVQSIDFNYREADFGGSPKGLTYSDMLLEKMLFDEENPLDRLKIQDAIDRIKGRIDTDYFENFIRDKILDNTHKVIVTMKPDADMNGRIYKELCDKICANYSKADKAYVADKLELLEKYRGMSDDERIKALIPVLSKEDLQEEKPYTATRNMTVCGIPFLFQPRDTNGIGYLNFAFDIRALPAERLPYVRLLVELLGVLDTKEHSYAKLTKLTDIYTGGIYNYVSIADGTVTNGQVLPFMIQRTSFFYKEIENVCSLNREILRETDYSDLEYIGELLLQLKSAYTSQLLSAANATASDIGRSGYSKAALYHEKIQGYEFYKFLCNLTDNYKELAEDMKENLIKTAEMLMRMENCRIIYVGEEGSLDNVTAHVKKFIDDLGHSNEADKDAAENDSSKLTPVRGGNQAYIAPSQVQYVAMCGDMGDKTKSVRGHMLVLEHILNCDYLWQNVRVMGGAYGCSVDFSYNGGVSFASYRDPGIGRTVDIFRSVAQYIRNIRMSSRELQQYIIGTMNKLDVPMTPESEAMSQIQLDFSGISNEEILRIRKQIIETTVEDIRALADIMENTVSDCDVVVIGSEEGIMAEKADFDLVTSLLGQKNSC